MTELSDVQPPLVHTVNEAAGALKLSSKTVRRLISRNKLRVVPGIRHHRITHLSLLEYVNGNGGN